MVMVLLAMVVTGLVIFVALPTSNLPRPKAIRVVRPARHVVQVSMPAAESGLLPWQLAAPVSRVVVLPGSGTKLVVMGGLTTGNASSNEVYSLDTSNGSLKQVGSLVGPVHDAAGAVVGGQDVVFGGGASSSVDTVQAFPSTPSVGTNGSSNAVATVVGSLPTPRSDAAVATVGPTSYLVGGYNGTDADAAVLATNDGRTFRSVASLPVPVRYPAVTAFQGKIYVFGGQAITGAQAGEPTNAIQVVDPTRHTVSVVGALPESLSGAVAVTLAGHIYVVGGDSTTPQSTTPGIGSTQIGIKSSSNPGVGKSGAITDRYVAGAHASADLLAATSSATTNTVSTIWAFDPASGRLEPAGRLQVPVSHAGVAVLGSTAWLVGGESNGTQVNTVQMITPNTGFGTAGAPGAGSPYFGAKLLIADRGNNRLLLMDTGMNVLWTYPSATSPTDALDFYFPDDAFFINKGTAIISNQERTKPSSRSVIRRGRSCGPTGTPNR